jgi:hypothetical protein
MIRFIYLYLLFILLACSIEAEEICDAPFISENIIGSWDVITSDVSEPSTVIFRSDGTGVDDSEEGPFIYYCRLNDEEIKNFEWKLDTLGDTEYIFLKY